MSRRESPGWSSARSAEDGSAERWGDPGRVMIPQAYRVLLADRRARRLLSGLGTSSLGDGMSTVTIAWLAVRTAPRGQVGLFVGLALAATRCRARSERSRSAGISAILRRAPSCSCTVCCAPGRLARWWSSRRSERSRPSPMSSCSPAPRFWRWLSGKDSAATTNSPCLRTGPRPGKSRPAGQAIAGPIQWLCSFRRLWTAAWRRHSERTAALPLRWKRRKPRLNLFCANAGSTVALRCL